MQECGAAQSPARACRALGPAYAQSGSAALSIAGEQQPSWALQTEDMPDVMHEAESLFLVWASLLSVVQVLTACVRASRALLLPAGLWVLKIKPS